MKSTTLALASLLASGAIAQPHRHQHQHAKKDAAPVVWVTQWDSVTEVIPVTTTIWVDAGFVAPTNAASPSTSSSSIAAPAPVIPAKFAENPNIPAVVASSSSSSSSSTSSSVYVAPTSTYVAPVVAAAAAPEQPAPVIQSSSSSVYVPPTTTSSVYTPPASSAAAPAYSAPAASSGGSGSGVTRTEALTGSGHNGIGTGIVDATCGQSGQAACAGDITYYTVAPAGSSCGIGNKDSEFVVALSHDMMGTASNSGVGDDANPYCGKTIHIDYNGQGVDATVVDKCMGCEYGSIDLSGATFGKLTADYTTLGRQQATWYFTS